MDAAFQPQIILLRDGTDTSQGKPQIVSNINACMAVAESVKSTLGPRGMDKLICDGRTTTISNDGATIMRLLDIEGASGHWYGKEELRVGRKMGHVTICSKDVKTLRNSLLTIKDILND